MNASFPLLDHLLALVVAVGYPIYAIGSYRRMRPALERNEPGVRLREYRGGLIGEWLLFFATLGVWLWATRPLADLGLGFPLDWRHAVGAGVAILIVVGLGVQTRTIARDPAARKSVEGQMGEFRNFLPHSAGELRTFLALSVTAGICEELAYRAYLIWYLDQFSGLWVAVLASSLIFGVAHGGYGPSTAVRAGLLGLFLAGLYLLTGALWVPIVVHMAFDVAAGTSGWLVNREAGPPAMEKVPG